MASSGLSTTIPCLRKLAFSPSQAWKGALPWVLSLHPSHEPVLSLCLPWAAGMAREFQPHGDQRTRRGSLLRKK